MTDKFYVLLSIIIIYVIYFAYIIGLIMNFDIITSRYSYMVICSTIFMVLTFAVYVMKTRCEGLYEN